MRLDFLMNLLATLRPRAGHVVIVERDDGNTFLSATFNPKGVLARFNGAGMLTHRWKAIESPHAEDIARQVTSQFEPHRRDAFGPWFLADYDDMLRVLCDYDPTSGRRWRDARFELGTRVQVTGAGRGYVKGFRGDRVVVRLDAPAGTSHEVIAARSIVKPVLRLIVSGVTA